MRQPLQFPSFFRSKAGRGFLFFSLFAALLSAAIGIGFYYSSLSWFAINKTEEKLTALQLVDAFIAEYTDARAMFNAEGVAGAPVPASFRAHAIDRFNRSRSGDDTLHLVMVGTPGREILTQPSDADMAGAIDAFQRAAKPSPLTNWVTIGGQSVFRTAYPSIASQQSCVDCHNQIQAGAAPWHLNDVMGALVIDVPVDSFLRRVGIESASVAAAAFMAMTLLGLYIFGLHFKQLAEREKSEAAVRVSEERFRDFTETASDWYWETDAQHRFSYISPHRGTDATHYIGRTREDVASPTDPNPAKWAAYHNTLDRHEPFKDFIYRIKTQDGLIRFLLANGKPIFNARGSFVGYRGTSRDVTEQIASAERLREAKGAAESANRSKSEFLANMSHELRTPLNAIIGFAEIIAKEMFGPLNIRQYKEYAGDITVSGGNLLEIINDILDMSKIEAGRLDLREEGVEIAGIVTACQRLIAARARDADVDVVCQIPANLPQLRADELRIKQILLNLLTNAVKFTPPSGRVTVSAFLLPEGHFELAVADTGIGMSGEQIELALQPFRQIDNSLARKSQGTGLGLPLVKAFTELHGGRLRIHSVPGEGTTVAVVLPASRVLTPKPADATV
ncbi:MAG TPA: ATP-binding protein [Alphaproteobacteria bacterium]